MGKPGSDAGMPGIEDSEVGKVEDAQFGKNWCFVFCTTFSVIGRKRKWCIYALKF